MVQTRHGKSQSQRQLLPQSRRWLQLLVWALPKKRNVVEEDPKKTPKAPKSTEVTPQKSATSTVEGGKEPSKPEQTMPTTTTAPSADAPVDQDPDVNESSSPIPPSDMNISKVGQASAAQIEIAALASAAVAASESVASTSAASALARTPTKTKKTSNARLQRGMQISTRTQRTKPTAKPSQRQAVSPSLLRRPHLLISRLRKHPNRKRKNQSPNLRKVMRLTPTATEGK